MNYTIHIGDAELQVQGDKLEDALEVKFPEIARMANIGNAAGYQLDDVRLVPGPGSDEMILQITYRGSDLLVNYDPREDKPRTVSISVTGVPEAERVETVVELVPVADKFNPFADLSDKPDDYRLGVAVGLFDEVSVNHCRSSENGLPISTDLIASYPTLLSAGNTDAALRLIDRRLRQRHPYDDEVTAKMISKAQELFKTCKLSPKCGGWVIYRAKTYVWFDQQGKQTALQKFRNSKGITQQQLADMVGISCRQIQNYEQPNSNLGDAKYSVVVAISSAIGCKPTDLVQGGSTVLVPKTE